MIGVVSVVEGGTELPDPTSQLGTGAALVDRLVISVGWVVVKATELIDPSAVVEEGFTVGDGLRFRVVAISHMEVSIKKIINYGLYYRRASPGALSCP